MRLDTILSRVRNHRAFDARDKVFGILGMYALGTTMDTGLGSRLLLPDYSKSTAEVYRDAVRHSIMSSDGDELYLLNMISHKDGLEIRADGFSSWVPRLDREYKFQVRTTG